MKIRQPRPSGHMIIIALYATMLGGFILLSTELWSLQVKGRDGFERVFQDQSIRRVRIPAVRGKIFDANDYCLADSVPNYCIAIYTHELRAPRSSIANTLELIHEIWSRVGVPPEITYKDIQRHINLAPNVPLKIYDNLTEKQIKRWRENFEKWTAPPRGSFRRKKITGLKLGHPIENKSIFIQTSELIKKRTSTAANTLELIYKISERIDLDREITFQDIKNHIYARRPLPLIAWSNLDETSLLKWADHCSLIPGSDIICLPARTYTEGKNFAHLIGYTMRADSYDMLKSKKRVHYDVKGLSGKKGIENIYNQILTGEPGYQLLQIDAAGFHNKELQVTSPIAGGDLYLTIDYNIQKMCNEVLSLKQPGKHKNQIKGAIVVLNANNGDVLGMASSPSFDPNYFMKSSVYRQSLMTDTNSSTFNRAVFGQYPPGSTFKIITALSALKSNPKYNEVLHDCRIGYKVGNRNMRCWMHSQGEELGRINLHDALMHSCNVYMYEIAKEIGFDPIYQTAKEFGIGQFAGLFPDLENPYNYPDTSYGNLPKKADNLIDLCNMSIGQGRLLTSPLQMAMLTSAIANGGTLYRPRLIKKFQRNTDEKFIEHPTIAIREIDINLEALETIRHGMRDVVMNNSGTATQARVKNLEIAGKTGSSQYRQKTNNKITNHVYAWMISYAPFNLPRYAVAMIIEDGVSGGTTIGPRLSDFYQQLFNYDGTLVEKGK